MDFIWILNRELGLPVQKLVQEIPMSISSTSEKDVHEIYNLLARSFKYNSMDT